MTTSNIGETGIERVGIQLHAEGAIRGALKAINDHKTGLPEFMKNSAGAYHRAASQNTLFTTKENRPIVLLFRTQRGRGRNVVGCLDLVGMTDEDVRLFQTWFDPNAAARGDPSGELWGGHGNGAKSYMLRMFEGAWFETVRDNRFTRMGYTGGDYRLGFIPSRAQADKARLSDPEGRLESTLRARFSTELAALPGLVRQVLRRQRNWTLFLGTGAKSWTRAQRLLELLQHNPQTVRTMEYCNVTAVVDGQPFRRGTPLESPEIPPLPGGETPLVVVVPESIADPEGGQISTSINGRYPPGQLVLRTSAEAMLYTLSHRHVVRCESSTKGVIGVFSVKELVGRTTDHIYGELHLDSLQEYETNFRAKPHESPLTRAVEAWLREQIEQFAERFRRQETARLNDQERNELQQLNNSMNRFLQAFLEEVEGEGGVTGEDGAGRRPGSGRAALPPGDVHQVEHNLGLGPIEAAENVAIYIRLRFLDATGNPVRPVPVHWETSDPRVADVELGSVVTGSPGRCEVWAVAQNGVRSAPVKLTVVHVDSIQVESSGETLPVGTRRHLSYTVRVADGARQGVFLDWHSDNELVVKVGSNQGVVTATGGPGRAEVWASALRLESNRVVIEASAQGSGAQQPQYPKVLLSEIEDDPDTGQPKNLDPEAGSVVQDVADRQRNIFWVNMKAPFAGPFLRGEAGLSYRSREFRMYLAERYAEVIFQSLVQNREQWEPGEILEALQDRPSRLRLAIAANLNSWLDGTWQL